MYFKSIPTFAWVLLVFISWFSLNSVGFCQNQDVARLVHPDVADRLSLTDAQRAQIQTLLQQRAEGMVAAPDAASKVKVKQDIDTKIVQEVLNEQQKVLFVSLEPQQKLMFQFREMKWDDVLTWFAKQQDLTLVMDRTPPGSFTYNDVRSYSPSEGIDLLNSVLMTHNFTLVRREKMLVVMELSDSIPLELIPRIKQDELAQRGRFELVSVAFALGGRPIEAVLAEVKPYLSNYGRAIPLAQGSQLMVIENAGKMQTINELILSVPVPKATPKPEPVPPPKPVFAAYPLGRLDPMSTLYTVIKLIPSDQITVDTKTGLLSAFVIPDQHKAIKAFLDEMTANVTTSPTSNRSHTNSREFSQRISKSRLSR